MGELNGGVSIVKVGIVPVGERRLFLVRGSHG